MDLIGGIFVPQSGLVRVFYGFYRANKHPINIRRSYGAGTSVTPIVPNAACFYDRIELCIIQEQQGDVYVFYPDIRYEIESSITL